MMMMEPHVQGCCVQMKSQGNMGLNITQNPTDDFSVIRFPFDSSFESSGFAMDALIEAHNSFLSTKFTKWNS